MNGKTITFKAAAAPAAAGVPAGSGVLGNIVADGAGNSTIYLGTSSTTTTATVGDVLTAIDLASGVKSTANASGVATFSTNSGQTASAVSANVVTLRSSTGADLSVTGSADFLKSLGLTTATGGGDTTVGAARTTSGTSVGNLIADGSTLNVNGKTITFKNAATPAASATHTGITGNVETDGAGNSTVYLQAGTVADVLKAIDLATGVQTAALGVGGATLTTATGQANSTVNSSGVLNISTGTASDLAITGTGNALSVLGLTGPTGTDTSFTRLAHRWRRRHQRQDLDLHLLQWRHGGQCHLRRRHRRHGQDARSVERRAAGQQPDRDARLGRQADDLGDQRLRLLDPRVGGGGRHDRRHRSPARSPSRPPRHRSSTARRRPSAATW